MKLNKKDFHLNSFINLLETKPFLGFLSVNNFKVQDKINLKIQLNKIGFDFKVLKNGLFINALETKFPKYIHIEALSQGFSIVIFPLTDKPASGLSSPASGLGVADLGTADVLRVRVERGLLSGLLSSALCCTGPRLPHLSSLSATQWKL